MRPGVRLGIDVGRARVGVASCDRDGLLATPVETVARGEHERRIPELLAEYAPIELVVGLPVSLRGGDTPSTEDARAFAEWLAGLGIPVRLVDERMSTNVAQRALRASGRSAKRSRSVVDQVAAVIILQDALDAERSSGREPGIRVESGGRAERGD
ncbi:Holliday junction resolvase RuvX [Homoserinibacter sp. YIM 151385]|uniref:Holliday junction resolvase RuvX n=1 Tax=Homoserinibacter sp. YIM 151385 TaxID=2985506 RepID=UPI0022F14275|nr:Holliday junction resolvase RuvX [Homoserinibacter sp. YIM 151385]WBU38669.1 Holliday junction resolvase RuvX [Homoserinibacter sp. YIM 151385]